MISLDGKSRFKSIPPTLDSTHPKGKDKWEKLEKSKSGKGVGSAYGSEAVRKEVRKYHGYKCIYCEGIPVGVSRPRIDHFRPKDGVKDCETDNFKGYFWLGYEWSNLVQSCDSCNTHKSNQFPLDEGSPRIFWDEKSPFPGPEMRSILSAWLKQEKRLLLNPEIDKVEPHFRFTKDGQIFSHTKRGKTTIQVLKLDRGDLIWRRKRKIDEYYQKLIRILFGFESLLSNMNKESQEFAQFIFWNDLSMFFEELLEAQSPEHEFSRLGFYMFHEFEDFFLQREQDGFTIEKDLKDHAELVRNFYRYLLSLT